jgi:tRNA threonylcarbamoyl adenosine modification protein YeaZ
VFVLALDTSSAAVVAGVLSVRDGAVDVLAARAPIAARGHGELLSPSVAECLDEAGVPAADIGAVVAGVGPGPYTSLRVGLVTAAAFADAVGAPTYGVCSLDAIAADEGGGRDRGDLVVLADARRREVYWARYDERRRRIDGPHVSPASGIPADGARQVLDRHPQPRALVDLALDRLAGGATSEALTPLYLRRPDAVVPGAPKHVSQAVRR